MDIKASWEYGDPVGSEARFREALAGASSDEELEPLSQIARTYSLRGRFDEAHALLDQVEERLGKAGPEPKVRCLLERGWAFNSAGLADDARPLFTTAWEAAVYHRSRGPGCGRRPHGCHHRS